MAELTAAAILARYATGLGPADIPPVVLGRARDCLIDTVAAIVIGHRSQAGRIMAAYMRDLPATGSSSVLGADMPRVRAEDAALANGTLAHALELDSLRRPGAGVHPGAVLVPAALAVAQERGLGGRAVLTAIVAGCEIMFRIGRATCHSAEARGFHAPGLTGPFGAAVAAGHLLGLDAAAMTRALGIAGSLGGGLLEFAASGQGGMVKRLHLGRAAAAGVTAARLAQAGFTGPDTVLEGKYGFLNAYCAQTDPAALTDGLGERWETLTLCLKLYPCHITAHTPVHAVSRLKMEHGFAGADVASVTVEGAPKMAAVHADRRPGDAVAAQYSIPFCVAAALLHDATVPETVFGSALDDPAVRDLCQRVEVFGAGGFASNWTTRTTVTLNNGRRFALELDDVPGMPTLPFDAAQLRRKFLSLTSALGDGALSLLDRLERTENEESLDWLTGIAVSADAERAHGFA